MTTKKQTRPRYALPLLTALAFSDATTEVRLDEDRIRVFIKRRGVKDDWTEVDRASGTFRNVMDAFVKLLQQPEQKSLLEVVFGAHGGKS